MFQELEHPGPILARHRAKSDEGSVPELGDLLDEDRGPRAHPRAHRGWRDLRGRLAPGWHDDLAAETP